MKKLALGLALGVVILLVAAYFAATFFLGHIVAAGIGTLGPRLTQTKVALAGVSISPLTGSGTLRGLAVGNPTGWSQADAFRVGRVHVDIAPLSLLGGYLLVEEITVDSPEFLYETKLVSSNIGDLQKLVAGFSGGAGGAQPGMAAEGAAMKIAVKKFRLTNGVARLGVGPAAVSVPLPPISLDEIGTAEGGVPPGQLAGVVMKAVLASIASGKAGALGEAAGAAGAAGAEMTKEAAKKSGEGLRKLLGREEKP